MFLSVKFTTCLYGIHASGPILDWNWTENRVVYDAERASEQALWSVFGGRILISCWKPADLYIIKQLKLMVADLYQSGWWIESPHYIAGQFNPDFLFWRILISYFEEFWFPVLKNPDFLLKSPDFPIEESWFLLKNVDFMLKTVRRSMPGLRKRSRKRLGRKVAENDEPSI